MFASSTRFLPRLPFYSRRPVALTFSAALASCAWFCSTNTSHAAAPAADFSTSFEDAETLKPFPNRVEVVQGKPWQTNIKSTTSKSLLNGVAAVTASSENPPDESAQNAADGEAGSKWLTFESTAWLQYKFAEPQTVASYRLVSGNDFPERDPRDWRLLGSDDGSTWTVLDTQKDQSWNDNKRGAAKSFTVAAARAFTYYRLDITANHSGDVLQLADWILEPVGKASEETPPMTTAIGAGPATGYNMKPRAGFTGMRSLRYAGQHTAAGQAQATNRLFEVKIPVGKDTRLSYRIFPELTGNDLQYPSTYTALDLHFTDGTQLSGLKPLDAYAIAATAAGQGEGKILYPNQWNQVRIDVGPVAAGKTIDAIQLTYDNPGGTAATAFQGWLDDVTIEAEPARIDGSSLTNYVDTRRGTNSSSSFSRGSNEAITAMPNGFNFLIPLSDALAQSREYSYQQSNDALNRPRFEGLGISHEPSPWMGDRDQFSVMPVNGGDAPSGNPKTRAVTFRHEHETAQPDYYGVDLDNGVKIGMTPSTRGMVMVFSFPANAGSVVLDSPTGDGEFTINATTGTVTGWIDHGAGFVAGQSRMFVSGSFDRAPVSTGLAAGGRSLTKYAAFNTSVQKTVTLRLATSLISLEQAGRNLAQEIGSRTFAQIREQARAAWNERLGVIQVEGATETQRVNLYGCLYRLNVYPNAQFENVGTAERPDYKYASPVNKPASPSTPTATGAKVLPGKMYVNNGFWDTYRTVWPAYALLYPDLAAELVDGFTDQYRAGGWISRWSSPGYANIMTGTSSDVAFADVYLRGVKLRDPLATFAAAVKNASTPSSNQNIGRKGLATSLFLGYNPASQGESVSWALEGYINDFGIGNMAAALARDPAIPEARRAELRDQSEYYLDRSRNYVKLFDPAIGFFQARNADGSFAVPADKYNPKTWWGPYTETNGWNFAFHAPHDPQGLVNLYGGKPELEAKLDAFFSTPEKSVGTIHEEMEARDGRHGQWGLSNQPSHHVPFLYNAAGAPAKAQKIVREALQRSYGGSEIGQGYPGDEDNGEMSAWYIFNALGMYPLQVGSGQLVAGSPLFTKATVRLGAGKFLVINAANNSATNLYVQSLAVNGAPHAGTSIDSRIFRTGGTLDYQMGNQPSAWGTGPQDGPPSLTTGTEVAKPMADTTGSKFATAASKEGEDVSALFDNSSSTEVSFKTNTPVVTITYNAGKQKPVFYTLTSASMPADPSAWVLEGSNDGSGWTTVDVRKEQAFADRRETIPFKIQKPGAFQRFRLSVTAGAPALALSEIELLAAE